MGIQAGVSFSKHRDAYQAGYEAAKGAMKEARIEKADLLIGFASSRFEQKELIRGIREAGGDAQFVGCTDAGEITNQGPQQGGVAVMAVSSESIKFHTGLGKDVAKGANEAGQAVAREVMEKTKDGDLRAFIMFPDVLAGNGAEIVRGVQKVLGEHFPILGGAAGDDFEFKKTYQYRDDEVDSGSVAGLGLEGEFSMGAGVRHGWIPIGSPMKVTKSEGALLKELDGRPAISIYEDYFGQSANELRKEPLARMAITYPLGLKLPGLEEYLIRDPIIAQEDGSITCAAEIPEGSEIRLMIGSHEKAVEAAQEAATKLKEDFQKAGTKPKFILMFNCIAREKLFGQRAKEEIDAVMEIVGRDVPLLGFYTYGEQAPMGGEVSDKEKISSRFYNETVVIFGIGE
ncbi:FIST C-terminal domain-containing protein [Patescibacteria group bacterium]|nr:FIST C-terminal domain-containing protein [Patescibacteria group bacterium]